MVLVKEMYPTKHGMCVDIIYVVVAVTFMFSELPVIVLWQWNCKLLGYYIEFYSSVSDEKMLALSKNKTNKQKIKKKHLISQLCIYVYSTQIQMQIFF